MQRINIFIVFIGLSLLGFSFSIDTYTDEADYNEAYLSIDRKDVGREESFRLFYALRDQYLTNKYRYQDYGLTLIIFGITLALIIRLGWERFSAPKKKWQIILLGFTASLLTVAGYVGDLFLEFFRGSYPHWADSLGIPLMGVPILAIIFITWAAINMLGLLGNFQPAANISGMGIKNLNWWFVLISIVTMIVLGLCLYSGSFWLVAPGLLWLYFYLSILAGRKAAK